MSFTLESPPGPGMLTCAGRGRGQCFLAASDSAADSDPPSGQLPQPSRRPRQRLTRTRQRSDGPKPNLKVGAETVRPSDSVTPRGTPSAPGPACLDQSLVISTAPAPWCCCCCCRRSLPFEHTHPRAAETDSGQARAPGPGPSPSPTGRIGVPRDKPAPAQHTRPASRMAAQVPGLPHRVGPSR